MTARQLGFATVIVAALIALLGSMAWVASNPRVAGSGWMFGGDRYGGMMGGSGMMGGGMMGGSGMMDSVYGLTGTGPVTSLEQARTAAERYADRLDLQVGEVMEFDNGFYAELESSDGDGATEVLVDPRAGDVHIEYGPAMMWNTEYGMHAAGAALPAQVSATEARELAEAWLDDRSDNLTAGEADEFPGYYTVHTERDDVVTGMLSVNAYTGAVWYHSWHGEFVDMSEH